MVIEDSVPGVTGARAAGMTVLGFFGGSHCTSAHEAMLRAAGAERTFADVRELPGMITGIGTEAVGSQSFKCCHSGAAREPSPGSSRFSGLVFRTNPGMTVSEAGFSAV